MSAPALALLLTAATPLFTPATGPIEVEADVLTATVGSGVYEARGNVVITRPGAVLRADSVRFDEVKGTAVAEGHAVLIEGGSVLECEKLELQVSTLTGTITGGSIRGQGAMALEAARVVRTGRRRFEVDGGSFTPCRCDPGEAPSWRIRASHADVDLDSGAWLTWPVLYAKDIPVFALPAFYLPLGERRTGLLMPRAGYSSILGVWVTEPLYVTLGRSWDATLEMTGYFERGPAPTLELRWAPTEDDRGQLRFTYFEDVAQDHHRFAVAGKHRTRGEHTRFAADVNLIGDSQWVSEIADRFLERHTEETVSRATWSITSSTGVRVAVGGALRQDLRVPAYTELVPLLEPVRVRFLELRADATPFPIGWADGPLYGEVRLSADAFAAPSTGVARFVRADVRPALHLPIDLFGLGVLEPSAALRLTGWRGEESASRFAAVFQTALRTELSRRYGRVVHVIRPELRHVVIPAVAGALPRTDAFATRDEIDALEATHQLAGTLATELWSLDTGARLAGASATFGGHLPLPNGAQAHREVILRADAAFGSEARFAFDGLAAIGVDDPVLSEAVARVDTGWSNRLGASAAIGYFGRKAPLVGLVAPEELVPSATLVHALDLAWSEGTVLDVSLRGRPFVPLELSAGVTVDVAMDEAHAVAERVRQAFAGARWDSPCECWNASLNVIRTRDLDGKDASWSAAFLLDLTGLGSAGR